MVLFKNGCGRCRGQAHSLTSPIGSAILVCVGKLRETRMRISWTLRHLGVSNMTAARRSRDRGRMIRMTRPFRQTGSIWKCPKRSRTARILEVCKRLETEYGQPRLGNPTDPLDDLIFIILSNRTSAAAAERVFVAIKSRFGRWDRLLKSSPKALRSMLKPIGLHKIRSYYIRATLRKIRDKFGRCDLTALRGQPEAVAFEFLSSLPGVSEKVAKCVMIYTLGAKVLPVDAHVFRVTRRLGWVSRNRADQCHEELEALVPAEKRYAFHVDCIAHGRAVCRPSSPGCGNCVIRPRALFKMT